MLKNLSEEIRECYRHAEDCARKAAAQTDPKRGECDEAGIFGTVVGSIGWQTGNVVSPVAPVAPDIPIPRTPCPGPHFPGQT